MNGALERCKSSKLGGETDGTGSWVLNFLNVNAKTLIRVCAGSGFLLFRYPSWVGPAIKDDERCSDAGSYLSEDGCRSWNWPAYIDGQIDEWSGVNRRYRLTRHKTIAEREIMLLLILAPSHLGLRTPNQLLPFLAKRQQMGKRADYETFYDTASLYMEPPDWGEDMLQAGEWHFGSNEDMRLVLNKVQVRDYNDGDRAGRRMGNFKRWDAKLVSPWQNFIHAQVRDQRPMWQRGVVHFVVSRFSRRGRMGINMFGSLDALPRIVRTRVEQHKRSIPSPEWTMVPARPSA